MIPRERLELVALDMDGTLLNTDHETTPYTREVLERVARAGKVVALSTGRCLTELTRHLHDIPGIGYVIGESGAWIYDVHRKETIREMSMDDDEVDFIFENARDLDAISQVFIDHQSLIECDCDEDFKRYHVYEFAGAFSTGSTYVHEMYPLCRANRGRVEKVNLYFSSAENCRIFEKRMAGRPVAMTASVGIGCEISPPNVDKGKGLQFLCEHLGITLSRAMAVGDGGNDLEIMAAAGFSVAMGNAIDAVRALADAVTEDCDHDGAARAIERYMLAE